MLRAVAIAAGVFLLAADARAADDRGVSAGVIAAASNMDAHTNLAIAGTFGFRFNRSVSLEIEATLVPTVKSQFPDVFIAGSPVGVVTGSPSTSIFPGPVFANVGGRLVIFSNNVRIDIPTTAARVTPYFVAGGGVGNLRRTADYTYRALVFDPLNPSIIPGGTAAPILRPIMAPVISTSTELVLNLGGGVSIDVARHLSVDGDLRVFRLFGQTDRNVGRFGAGVRFRY